MQSLVFLSKGLPSSGSFFIPTFMVPGGLAKCKTSEPATQGYTTVNFYSSAKDPLPQFKHGHIYSTVFYIIRFPTGFLSGFLQSGIFILILCANFSRNSDFPGLAAFQLYHTGEIYRGQYNIYKTKDWHIQHTLGQHSRYYRVGVLGTSESENTPLGR